MYWILGLALVVYLIYRFTPITIKFTKPRDRRQELQDLRRLHETMSGSRCHKCGERYVGLAMDCKCTNYGE